MAACHCNTFDRNQAVQLSGVRKVDIGKEAILRAAAALQATDELGVVAFNERANWVVKRTPLGSITDLQGSLGGDQRRRPDEHLRRPRRGREGARGAPRRPGAT